MDVEEFSTEFEPLAVEPETDYRSKQYGRVYAATAAEAVQDPASS